MNQYHLNTFNIFKNPHLVLLILILATRIILKILAPFLPWEKVQTPGLAPTLWSTF